MTTRIHPPRPRPRSLRSGAFFIVLTILGSMPATAPAVAQEPDTTRTPEVRERDRDSRRATQDSAAQDTAAVDTVAPPPTPLPALGEPTTEGWARGVWEWDRDDLLRFPDLSLLDLLQRIPGLVPVRADIAGQPEGAAVFGAAAGSIRYVVDGFVLDPLTAPTFDPSRYSLLALERVRVERRVTGATVRIETLTPDDSRTRSVIEAGTGDYEVNLFRGIFLPPRVIGGALGMGFERLSVAGFRGLGSSNHNTTWLKWTWARESGGIQVEYRQSTVDRTGVGPALTGARSDWAVRARRSFGPLTGEAYVGGTAVEDELGGDSALTTLREAAPQGGLRIGASLPGSVPTRVHAALRFRSHPRLPSQEMELRAATAPLPWLTVEAEAVQGWWADSDPTGRWSVRAAVGPVLGLTAFGEAFRGGALTGSGSELALPAPADSAAFNVSRDGYRAGLEYARGGFLVGGAAVQLSMDTVFGFGLPMEETWVAVPGGDAHGFEVTARIPTGIDPFSVQGWYVGMDAPAGWLYLPAEHWRIGLVYHHLPLESGNLEIYGRAEHVFRGRMNVPGATGGVSPTQVVAAYRHTNLELNIRVLSVRAFIRWSNVLHRVGQGDLPAFDLPGQNILWGVKWHFWN